MNKTLWVIRHAECPMIYLLGWWSRHHSPRSMDAYWQIIYRNITAEQSLHVSSIYHDCCWKYINNIIVYRFSRSNKGIFIFTSYWKILFFLLVKIIDVIGKLFTIFIFFLFPGNQVPFTFIFYTSFPHVCCSSSRGCDSLCF